MEYSPDDDRFFGDDFRLPICAFAVAKQICVINPHSSLLEAIAVAESYVFAQGLAFGLREAAVKT